MYGIYNSKHSGEVKQVVVPNEDVWNDMMNLAHELNIGGHLGTRKTADRITSSLERAFYIAILLWPNPFDFNQ